MSSSDFSRDRNTAARIHTPIGARGRLLCRWGAVLPLLGLAFCLAPGSAAPPTEGDATKTGDDPAAVEVQSLDKVKADQQAWGSLRWLMNAEVDPNAKTTFGIVKIKAHQQNPFHTHPNCEEILYVLSGSCEHRLGDRVDVLKAGDLIRIPAGVPHGARTLDEPMESIVVYSTGRREFVVVEEEEQP